MRHPVVQADCLSVLAKASRSNLELAESRSSCVFGRGLILGVAGVSYNTSRRCIGGFGHM